jgi:hypothetical protein
MKQPFADVFVEKWLAKARITTFGPSGIGFVNFGLVRDLRFRSASSEVIRQS